MISKQQRKPEHVHGRGQQYPSLMREPPSGHNARPLLAPNALFSERYNSLPRLQNSNYRTSVSFTVQSKIRVGRRKMHSWLTHLRRRNFLAIARHYCYYVTITGVVFRKSSNEGLRKGLQWRRLFICTSFSAKHRKCIEMFNCAFSDRIQQLTDTGRRDIWNRCNRLMANSACTKLNKESSSRLKKD